MSNIKQQVESIANQLENGITFDYYGMDASEFNSEPNDIISGYDYLTDVLDIQYIVNSDSEFIGARVLVAFGGPNIWIDTARSIVEGAWWQDSYTVSYGFDAMGLEEALRELWECRA